MSGYVTVDGHAPVSVSPLSAKLAVLLEDDNWQQSADAIPRILRICVVYDLFWTKRN